MIFLGDHFYTVSEDEREGAKNKYGFKDECIAGYVFPPELGNRPDLMKKLEFAGGVNRSSQYPLLFHRFWHPTDHHYFAFLQAYFDDLINNKGFQDDGPAFYAIYGDATPESLGNLENVLNLPAGSFVPFWHIYLSSAGDHFYSTNEGDINYAIDTWNFTDKYSAMYIVRPDIGEDTLKTAKDQFLLRPLYRLYLE